MSRPSRNDPCPCGSGAKYKKCCLPREGAAQQREPLAPDEQHFICEIRPDVDEAVNRLMAKLQLGAGRQIESAIAELLQKYPDYHTTNFAMGAYRAVVMRDPAGAVPFFEKAIEIFPQFIEAHFNLGNAARQTLDIPKAVAAYRTAERYSRPSDEIGKMARDELQALEAILVQNSPFPNLDSYVANAKLFDEAFECLRTRQFERAIALFQRVLLDNPKHVQSCGNMALAYAGLGRRAEALACFDRALELDPAYEPARQNRRCTESMREGEPFIPELLAEVNFYADRLRQRPASDSHRSRQ